MASQPSSAEQAASSRGIACLINLAFANAVVAQYPRQNASYNLLLNANFMSARWSMKKWY
jgi:hypothetical protein